MAVHPVTITIAPYAPDQAARWDAFVERSPNGLMLFQRGYMDYHADRFAEKPAHGRNVMRAQRRQAAIGADKIGGGPAAHPLPGTPLPLCPGPGPDTPGPHGQVKVVLAFFC